MLLCIEEGIPIHTDGAQSSGVINPKTQLIVCMFFFMSRSIQNKWE
jgi:hypothetical protein